MGLFWVGEGSWDCTFRRIMSLRINEDCLRAKGTIQLVVS